MLTAVAAGVRVDSTFAELRRTEFARLDAAGLAYLDYGGAALHGESQLRAHHALLEREVFGNPHSESTPSRRSTATIEQARVRVLRFLDADPGAYTVCFTANASAAVKLVAESFPFGPQAPLILAADNHNSVNGMREYAARAGAPVYHLPLDGALALDDPATRLANLDGAGRGLFAFPAQSNFSGVRHPLALLAEAQSRGHAVLLDAAALVSSRALSLRAHPADFVALSFYKIFGYPTGVGALVARRDALARLRRPWFAGGTVEYVSVRHGRHLLRSGAEAFEDGTPSFLALAALDAGFDLVERAGMARISSHVGALGARLLAGLSALRHRDGAPLVRIYGPGAGADRGATVAFNVLDRRGRPLPYAMVEDRARERGVAVRGGCFCNPGASERAFAFDPEATARCLDALGERFTIERFARCLGSGAAVGAVRASLGLANDERDVQRGLEVVASFAE